MAKYTPSNLLMTCLSHASPPDHKGCHSITRSFCPGFWTPQLLGLLRSQATPVRISSVRGRGYPSTISWDFVFSKLFLVKLGTSQEQNLLTEEKLIFHSGVSLRILTTPKGRLHAQQQKANKWTQWYFCRLFALFGACFVSLLFWLNTMATDFLFLWILFCLSASCAFSLLFFFFYSFLKQDLSCSHDKTHNRKVRCCPHPAWPSFSWILSNHVT